MRPLQLDIYGGAWPLPTRRPQRLTAVQRSIMRWARANGAIRSVEAGRVVHHHRGHCGHGSHDLTGTRPAIGCCGYAPIDGRMAIRRLEDRGLLENAGKPGLYRPAVTA